MYHSSTASIPSLFQFQHHLGLSFAILIGRVGGFLLLNLNLLLHLNLVRGKEVVDSSTDNQGNDDHDDSAHAAIIDSSP